MGDQRSDPPGAVSDQNREEQPSGLRDDERHPEPRVHDDTGGDRERTTGSGRSRSVDGDNEGEAKEGSQSTGHPDNAG